jgi:hypothetical protein
VRQFLDHRIHLYRHRVEVRWGGGDPRMVLADGETFVGIAPLGRMRKMEEVEELLKVSELRVIYSSPLRAACPSCVVAVMKPRVCSLRACRIYLTLSHQLPPLVVAGARHLARHTRRRRR